MERASCRNPFCGLWRATDATIRVKVVRARTFEELDRLEDIDSTANDPRSFACFTKNK
jgi:hypothetical protein